MVTFVTYAQILARAVDTLAVNAAVGDTFVVAALASASVIAVDAIGAVVRSRGVPTRAMSAFVVAIDTFVDVLVTVCAFPSSGAVTAAAGDMITAAGNSDFAACRFLSLQLQLLSPVQRAQRVTGVLRP